MQSEEMRWQWLKLYTNREILNAANIKRTKSQKHLAGYVPVCVVSKKYTKWYVIRYIKVSDIIDYTSK